VVRRSAGRPGSPEVARANAARVGTLLRIPASAALRGAGLAGEDLSYRDLDGVDLTGADLTGALCRFEVGELDGHLPEAGRLPLEEPSG